VKNFLGGPLLERYKVWNFVTVRGNGPKYQACGYLATMYSSISRDRNAISKVKWLQIPAGQRRRTEMGGDRSKKDR
jgi:hypothetical protein